jgi:lysophospholipase L1-like esterase
VRTLCQGLQVKYPNADIFFFSSPQNNYVDRPANELSGTKWDSNTEGYNRKGYTLQDYAAAMEEVCKDQGVYFYSLTDALPWGLEELGNNEDQTGIYGSDALHPNADGHSIIANEMARFILNALSEQ